MLSVNKSTLLEDEQFSVSEALGKLVILLLSSYSIVFQYSCFWSTAAALRLHGGE
jgi:hypothetical protein